MDRDDVEHLFKDRDGFTFRDRKQFWNTLQRIVSDPVDSHFIHRFCLSLAIEFTFYRKSRRYDGFSGTEDPLIFDVYQIA